jgi:chromosome partitioning protein
MNWAGHAHYSRRSRFGAIAAESSLRYRLRTDNAQHKHGDDMAAILVLGGIKGGIGKSTIASNLSVLAARGGHETLLIDADPQETTATWAAARSEHDGLAPVTTVSIVGKQIRDELRKLSAKYDTIIVDSGARDSITQRAALSVAQTVLLPFPPRGPDLWTLDAVVQTIADIRMINETLRGIAFVNRADPFGHDNDEAEEAFAEHAGIIEAAPVRVGNRKGIAVAHLGGMAAVEMLRPDPKAVAELDALFRCVFDMSKVW